MAVIWTPNGICALSEYDSEADLEASILKVKRELFGETRIYLDIKKKLGRNVPDGYLIDLSGQRPKLYFVENELSSHDPLRHIAMQLLEFSLSFESEPRTLKKILLDAVHAHAQVVNACQIYASQRGYRGLDHLIDEMVYGAPFAALVIIDEIPERLESILARKFRFAVEILEVVRYISSNGHHIYHFEPFLYDLAGSLATKEILSQPLPDLEEIDTVIVPAREEGFNNVFLAENRWHSIRLNGIMRPQIKWIAAYQVAPISAITHVAPVSSIEPWEDTNKFVLNFTEPAHSINPIRRGEKLRFLQNIKYTTFERLENAKTLDDL